MILNDQRRRWCKVVAVLLVLLPAFPLFLFCGSIAFSVVGVSHLVFLPALIAHNLYYRLPAMIFGESLFPAEEFGLIPTSAGYAVAAILYALIAIVLSFPVCWLLKLREQETHAA